MKLTVRASDAQTRRSIEFSVRLRIDTPTKPNTIGTAAFLQYVLRQPARARYGVARAVLSMPPKS